MYVYIYRYIRLERREALYSLNTPSQTRANIPKLARESENFLFFTSPFNRALSALRARRAPIIGREEIRLGEQFV